MKMKIFRSYSWRSSWRCTGVGTIELTTTTMAALLASSSPPSFSSSPNSNHNPRRLLFLRPIGLKPLLSLPFSSAASSRYPRLASLASVPDEPLDQRIPGNQPPDDKIADELGEKSQQEAPSAADPPNDGDEWGEDQEQGKTSAAVISDEWGEKAEPEPEEPSQPDPPKDDDEWGREPEGVGYLSGNGTPVPSDKLGDLKRCLVDSLYGAELGLRTSAEDRADILEIINQLEAENPTSAPMEAPELLDGNWILLYTAFSELLPLLAVGSIPFLKVKKISQVIDSKSMTIVNATTLSSPFATFSFSASASFEVRSPSRIQVQFKEGTFQPPEISSSLDLPEKIDIFGQKIDLKPVQQTLNPIQEAIANITRAISVQSPLKVPLPGNRAMSWLFTSYLDEDFRISRGDGGLFVLAKEGSTLLDQLS